MRKERSPEELERAASRLAEISQIVGSVADKVRSSGMPTILIHGDTTANRYLPFLYEWAKRMDSDADVLIAAHVDGREARAHADKKRNDDRKMQKRSKSK